MKTIKIITVLSLLFVSNLSIAGNGENKFKKQLSSHVLYPKLEKSIENNVNVFVKFTVKDNCTINIDKIESSNIEFENYVIQKINELENNIDLDVIGKSFEYNFTFEVQN